MDEYVKKISSSTHLNWISDIELAIDSFQILNSPL